MKSRLLELRSVFCTTAFTLPIVALLAPKSVVILLCLAALWALAALRLTQGRWPKPALLSLAPIILFLVWAAVASLWSFDVTRSLILVLRVGVLFAGVLVLLSAVSSLSNGERAKTGFWLCLGCGLVLVLLVVERVLGTPFMDLLRGPTNNLYDQLSRFNRGLTALAILCWPASAWLGQRFGTLAALAFPVGCLFVALFYESSATLLGLSGGLTVLVLALWQPRLSRYLVLVGTIGALLATPLIARGLTDMGLGNADWLQRTAVQRVVIWDYAAERIAERPLLGWGFDAARHMPDTEITGPGGLTSSMPLHPHNAALQVMLELGLPGSFIALVLLCCLLLGIARQPLAVQPYSLATYSAALAIALTAFGIWQNHWLALLGLAVVLVNTVALEKAGTSSPP